MGERVRCSASLPLCLRHPVQGLDLKMHASPVLGPGRADRVRRHAMQMDHARFLDHIIDCAFRRRSRKLARQLTEVRYQHQVGYALFATRDIQVGEVVVHYEERPHVIATRQHIARTFGAAAVPPPCPVGLPGWRGLEAYKAELAQRRLRAVAAPAAYVGRDQAEGASGSPTPGAPALNGHHEPLQAGGCSSSSQGTQVPPCDEEEATSLKGQWFKAYAYPISDEVRPCHTSSHAWGDLVTSMSSPT